MRPLRFETMSELKPTENTAHYRQSIDEGYTPVAKPNIVPRSSAVASLPRPPRGGSGATSLKSRK